MAFQWPILCSMGLQCNEIEGGTRRGIFCLQGCRWIMDAWSMAGVVAKNEVDR